MSLFEFGPFWDSKTFCFFLVLGVVIAKLCSQGAKSCAIKGEKKWNGYYYIAFFVLWFFYTFKSSKVGTDTLKYLTQFDNAMNLEIDVSRIITFHQTEPLYILFIQLIRRFTDSHTVYLGIVGLIVSYGYIKYIITFWDEKSNYIFLTVLMVSYYSSMSGVRNALGTAFILSSLCAMHNGKIIKCLILNIVGMFFHYTMFINILVIVYYYIFKQKKNFSKKNVVIPTIVLSCIILPFIGTFNTFFSETKYSFYSDSGGSIIGHWYIIAGIIGSAYTLATKKYMDKKDYFNILITLCNIPILVIVLGTSAYRLVYYYALPRVTAWSYMFRIESTDSLAKIQNQKVTNVMCWGMVIVYMLFRFSRFSANSGFAYSMLFGM